MSFSKIVGAIVKYGPALVKWVPKIWKWGKGMMNKKK